MSRIYLNSAKVLEGVLNEGRGLKTLLLSENKSVCLLVTECLKYVFVLDRLFRELKLVKLLKLKSDKYLAVVMVYDFCLGQNLISGGGSTKRKIMRFSNRIKEWIARFKIKKMAVSNSDLLDEFLTHLDLAPMYARINRLKPDKKFEIFGRDDFVPHLVKFNRKILRTNSILQKWLEDNSLIIQDKSSCLPVMALSRLEVDFSKDVIDACAAPGSKTLQLAELMALHHSKNAGKIPKGRIFAFDVDPKRCQILSERVQKMGFASLVKVCCQNFLKVDFNSRIYSNVATIMVDPSCSGSGVLSKNIDQWVTSRRKSPQRLIEEAKLYSAQQISLLCHAAKFASVGTIIYSTCSIDERENECVVAEIVQNHKDFALLPILPEWERRGNRVRLEDCEKVVRVSPVEDGTCGFFVAAFGRIGSGEQVRCGCAKSEVLRFKEVGQRHRLKPLFE